MHATASPPATPPRVTTAPSPPPSASHHPFSGTAKGSGQHPSFSKDHYESPSHTLKLERLKATSPSPSSATTVTPRTFGRSVSAPASANIFGSPAEAASNRLQGIVEESSPVQPVNEGFDAELAGSNRQERQRIKSRSTNLLLFGSVFGARGLGEAFGQNENVPVADDDIDWPAGQADADADDEEGVGPRASTSTSLFPLSPLSNLPSFSLPSPPRSSPAQHSLQAPFQPRGVPGVPQTEEEVSDAIFDREVDQAVTLSRASLNLMNAHIVRIPPSVRDMNLVTSIGPSSGDLAASTMRWRSPKTPKRIASSPSAFCPSPVDFPSPSSSAFRSNQLSISLAVNAIRVLPLHLFELTNLTVLTLRQNKIEEIPPAIGRLVNLVDLNISNNRIQYLPSEIVFLKELEKLWVNGNPWITSPAVTTTPLPPLDPTPSPSATPPPPPRMRVLGPLTCKSRVPSLTELCLRRLCPPSPAERPHLSAAHLASPFLSRSHKYREKLEDRDGLQQLALGRCAGCGKGFFEPAEERMEWTTIRAAAGRPTVPIKWRGCTGGCLAFLEKPLEEVAAEEA